LLYLIALSRETTQRIGSQLLVAVTADNPRCVCMFWHRPKRARTNAIAHESSENDAAKANNNNLSICTARCKNTICPRVTNLSASIRLCCALPRMHLPLKTPACYFCFLSNVERG